MLSRKRKLVEKSTGLKTGQLLDVGTGTGFFLNEMKNAGWQITGTEKSKDAREFSKKEFGLDILETEELFNFDEESFDVITLWHVLEHIHRLNENMQRFNELLTPKGKLIIAVPNHTSYDARLYKEYLGRLGCSTPHMAFWPGTNETTGRKTRVKITWIKNYAL